jgi:hypothetical protein
MTHGPPHHILDRGKGPMWVLDASTYGMPYDASDLDCTVLVTFKEVMGITGFFEQISMQLN